MTSPKPYHVYVAGPMRGIAEFNFPLFCSVTRELRAKGWVVFNPAERDLEAGFDPTGLKGTDEELAQHEFCLRSALGADTKWICENADAIYLLPNSIRSTGAVAERALGEALGLDILYHNDEGPSNREKIRDILVEDDVCHAIAQGLLQCVANRGESIAVQI